MGGWILAIVLMPAAVFLIYICGMTPDTAAIGAFALFFVACGAVGLSGNRKKGKR